MQTSLSCHVLQFVLLEHTCPSCTMYRCRPCVNKVCFVNKDHVNVDLDDDTSSMLNQKACLWWCFAWICPLRWRWCPCRATGEVDDASHEYCMGGVHKSCANYSLTFCISGLNSSLISFRLMNKCIIVCGCFKEKPSSLQNYWYLACPNSTCYFPWKIGLPWLIYSSIAANNAPYMTMNLPTIYSAFMVTENWI
jgi:hypothetical protein